MVTIRKPRDFNNFAKNGRYCREKLVSSDAAAVITRFRMGFDFFFFSLKTMRLHPRT